MWSERAGLTFITGLAIGLRLFGLDRKSVWFDEAVSYLNALAPWAELLESMRHDVHPPLSYALLHLWPWTTAGEFGLRLPSALLGGLAAPVAWAWARRIASPREALLTGLFVAVMPLQVDLAQEARMYGLFLLLTATSLLLLDWLLVQPTRARMAAFALVAAAMLYTHYYAAFVLAAEGLAVLLAAGTYPRGAALSIAGLAFAGLAFTPWLPIFIGQVSAIHGDYWIEAPSSTTLWVTFRDMAAHTPPDEPFRVGLRVAYVVQAALLTLGLFQALRCARQRIAGCLLAVPIVLSLAISLTVAPIYAVRYLSPVGLAFAFLLARGTFSVGRLPAIAALIGLYPMLLSLWFLFFDPGYGRADLRTAAAMVNAQRRPDEIVLHLGHGTAAPFDYYGVAQPAQVLETDSRQELCSALRARSGGWLVTTYAAEDDHARATAEAAVLAPTNAGDLVREPPYRLQGLSLLHLSGC